MYVKCESPWMHRLAKKQGWIVLIQIVGEQYLVCNTPGAVLPKTVGVCLLTEERSGRFQIPEAQEWPS